MQDISGSTFSQEYDALVKERDDLETPHNCTAEIEAPDVGAPLDQLEAYAEEFHKLVEEMFEKLPDETRVLEGTDIPTYDELYQQTKNELSETNDKEGNGECSGNVDS
jgi:lysyl-tRNA synthetase class I